MTPLCWRAGLETFTGADDITLVIYAPGWSPEDAGARLGVARRDRRPGRRGRRRPAWRWPWRPPPRSRRSLPLAASAVLTGARGARAVHRPARRGRRPAGRAAGRRGRLSRALGRLYHRRWGSTAHTTAIEGGARGARSAPCTLPRGRAYKLRSPHKALQMDTCLPARSAVESPPKAAVDAAPIALPKRRGIAAARGSGLPDVSVAPAHTTAIEWAALALASPPRWTSRGSWIATGRPSNPPRWNSRPSRALSADPLPSAV